MSDPAQVLDVLRDVLLEHMNDPEALPEYQVKQAVLVGGRTGRLITEEDVSRGHDVPAALLLIMGDGSEFHLRLENAVRDEW